MRIVIPLDTIASYRQRLLGSKEVVEPFVDFNLGRPTRLQESLRHRYGARVMRGISALSVQTRS